VIPKPSKPKRYFRPWGTDSVGEVTAHDKSGLTVRYQHDPDKTQHIPANEVDKVGRFVTATDFH
jgi:hypothetical protein